MKAGRNVNVSGNVSGVGAAAAAAWLAIGPAVGPAAAQVPETVEERPIYGAWLRPNPAGSLLTNTLDDMAEAGLTDLFLESFYHGLATHDSAILRERFGADVLASTIVEARKRGILVHAWLEAAYWSFGGLGEYLFEDNPEWRVTDDEGNTDIGDIPGQVFVNLGNPGVQAVMAEISRELAANYPMLEGVHTDYHRFPLDNDLGDGQIAPYSFDSYSRQAFEDIYGVDPLFSARFPSQPFYDEFVEFRRRGIAEAAGAMHDAILAEDAGKLFSGAVFASAILNVNGSVNTSQFVKMQDWPLMAANGWLPIVIPMAYGTSTTGIRNDLQAALNQANGSRIVPGLAIINPQSRPDITQQLTTSYGLGLESFVFFEAQQFAISVNRQQMAAFLSANAPRLAADLDGNGRVAQADFDTFYASFTPGQDLRGGGALDLNGDRRINAADEAILLRQLRDTRFGADGRVGEDEYAAVLASFTAPGELWPRHLFDLTEDGVVDCADVAFLRLLITDPVPVSLNPDLDGDGGVSGADEAAFVSMAAAGEAAADVDGSGGVDVFDVLAYLGFVAEACP